MSAADALRVDVLGPLRVRVDGVEVDVPDPPVDLATGSGATFLRGVATVGPSRPTGSPPGPGPAPSREAALSVARRAIDRQVVA